MIKRVFSGIVLVIIAVALIPPSTGLAAPSVYAPRTYPFDGEDICSHFGNAQAICRQFLRFLEANRALAQSGDSSAVFDWLDENIGGQLQIVHLEQPSASTGADQLPPFQVHVFVTKGDQPAAKQASTRDYQLFVIVLDQDDQPISGARVDYVVEYVDHRETHTIPLPTNAEGVASTQFKVELLPTYQMVKVGVLVNTAERQQNAGTAFWGGY